MRRLIALLLLLLFLGPVLASAVVYAQGSNVPWYEARRDATGMAPDPATTPEAVIQVYAARTVSWRGIFAVHTWISVKPSNAPRFTRYEVVGFNVARGIPTVSVDRMGPDNYWFGAKPDLILDKRGAGIDELIAKVQDAVKRYPYPDFYRPWPGPNSNTFTAFVGREVPALGLDLPSNAIGKDYIPHGIPVAIAPSGTGVQFSLFGALGVLVALDEGIEVNVLGLNFGIDFRNPGVKLPALGKIP